MIMNHLFRSLLSIAATLGLVAQSRAQLAAFAYSGQLNNNGVAANGTYDFRFTLFGTNLDGTPIGSPLEADALAVAGGAFTVSLDFPNGFDGSDRWLEIEVRT